MTGAFRKHLHRAFALFLCISMICAFSGAVLPDDTVFDPESCEAFAASEKSITIYTSGVTNDMINARPDYYYASATGLDTLVLPAGATGFDISWSSDDPNVASVDSRGHVLGRLAGSYAAKSSASTYIRAKCTWNGQTKTDSIKVTVKKGIDITGNYFTNSVGTLSSASMAGMNTAAAQEPESDSNTGSSDEAESGEYSTFPEDPGQDIETSLKADHVEGEILVTFGNDTPRSEIKKIITDNDAELGNITPLGEDNKIAVATADSEDAMKETMEGIAEEDSVVYVQPNYIYTLDGGNEPVAVSNSETAADAEDADQDDGEESTAGASGTMTLNSSADPYYRKDGDKNQYFHWLMNVPAAWDLLEKNEISGATTVGVLDSGVDTYHEDLTSNLVLQDGMYTRFSGNSRITANTDIMRGHGHGTHVSGIIGAVYGNGKGGAGVASGRNNELSKVLMVGVVRIIGGYYVPDTLSIINGINYAVYNGAKVINMSFGGPAQDRELAKCISDYYYGGKTVVFVGSAGNKEEVEQSIERSTGRSRVECFNFPAEMKEVINVCNIDSSGKKDISSYSGLTKDISAPGTFILSTNTYNPDVSIVEKYYPQTGTSMSSPAAAGVAALMLDANPKLSAKEVRNIMCATAYDTADDYYKKNEIGYGRIDAAACVKAAYEAGKKTASGDLKFSIKGYYNGEPEPFVLSTYSITSKKYSLSKVPSYSTKADKKKIRLSFNKAVLTTKATKNKYNQYITEKAGLVSIKTTNSTSRSGLYYQIRIKSGKTTKYYKTQAKNRRSAAFNVSVNGNKVKVTLKKFGNARLKSKRTYQVSVRAYKTIGGKTYKSKWSPVKKIKVK